MEVSGQLHAPAALTVGTYWIGGWVGPGAGLALRKNLTLSGIEPRPFNQQPVPILIELSRLFG
jgi:hypothetical protein